MTQQQKKQPAVRHTFHEKSEAAGDTVWVPWGPIFAIVSVFVLFLLSQFFAAFAVYAYGSLQGWDVDQIQAAPQDSVIVQFAYIALVESFTIGPIIWYLRRTKATFASIGLTRPRLRDIGYAVAGFGIYFPLYFVVIQFVSSTIPTIDLSQKQEIGFSTATSGGMLGLVFVSLVILPPIAEEILFRGFLYSGLRKRLTKVAATLLTAVVFAIPHLQLGMGNALLWVAAVDTFILSLVLVGLRERTGGIWASIGLHMIKNGLAFISLFVLKVA